MNRKNEVLILSVVVIIFTSLFVNVPLRIKVNQLENVVTNMGAPHMFETANINEVLVAKLFLTYLLFSKTDICLKEFVGYVLGLEVLLLLVVRKASFVLHTSCSIFLFLVLEKFFPGQRNASNKPILL